MRLDASHPLNRLVLEHLRNRAQIRFRHDPISVPQDHPDPYLRAGSHPDVVERVWDTLGAVLPVDCRVLVYGVPALVHSGAGVVLALAYGTQYALRIPETALDEAVRIGCKTRMVWGSGGETVLESEFGGDWVFGCWAGEEEAWLLGVYEAVYFRL